jgi:hypothetical protein
MNWLSEPAPTWVSLVTALVALLSLAVAAATFFRAGPRVKMSVKAIPDEKESAKPRRFLMRVRLTNSGLAEVQIKRIRFSCPFGRFELRDEDVYGGDPQLGEDLKGGKQVEALYRLERGLETILRSESLQRATGLWLYSCGICGDHVSY